jgi:hypothetical protein
VSALTIAPAVRPWEASLEMITRVTMRYSAQAPRSTAGRVPSRRSVASLAEIRRQLGPEMATPSAQWRSDSEAKL